MKAELFNAQMVQRNSELHTQIRLLEMKAARGNPHKLVITLSNLFTTPLATDIPFNWKDLTPVAMLALDEFVLWVNAEKPYQNVKEYLEAAKKASPGSGPNPGPKLDEAKLRHRAGK